MSALLIPVCDRYARGYPDHAEGVPAHYGSISDAFTTTFEWDAHFATYSVPSVARRLAGRRVFDAVPDGVPMVLFVVDIEPADHKRTDEWDAIEAPKVGRAIAAGAYFYSTRNGYRLVWRLAEPFVIRSARDADSWKRSYEAALDAVAQRFDIKGDRSCGDWTRLYRLPFVTRDGEPQQPETSDVQAMGTWALAIVEAPEQPPRQPTAAIEGALTLDSALAAWCPDAVIDDDADGRRAVVPCPWASKHTTGSDEAMAFERDGVLGFKCLHAHCTTRGWQDFRRYHDPEYRTTVERAADRELFAAVAARISEPSDATSEPSLLGGAIDLPTPERRAIRLADVGSRPKPPVQVYPTGHTRLDELLGGGLWSRRVLGIAAPTASGKTGYAVDLATRLEPHVPVLYVSTELEDDEVRARFAAPLVDVSWRDLIKYERTHKARVDAALAGKRIHVVGCDRLPRESTGDVLCAIRDEALALATEYGVSPAVFIDYMQQLARGTTDDNTRARVGDVAGSLRELSQQLDSAMVAVLSVSRAYYGTAKVEALRNSTDPTVYLAAAKESGDVEYDLYGLLYLDVEPNEPGKLWRYARVAVAKSRFGETDFVGSKFFGATGRWESCPEALPLMTKESRVERKRDEQANANENKLLAAIRKHPTSAWRHVRAMSGISPLTEADAARDRLFKRGLLVSETQEYLDSMHRTCKRNVLRVVGDPLPSDVRAMPALAMQRADGVLSKFTKERHRD